MAIAYDRTTVIPGVFARHDDNCPVRNGRRCTCGILGYRASVRDWEADRRILSPQFATAAEARAWLADQMSTLQAARGWAMDGRELGDVVDEFLEAAQEGRACDRVGERYAADGLHDLRGALSYVDSELGLLNIADIRRPDVQSLVDQLVASGLTVARVYGVVDALDALYAYAIQNGIVGFSPVVWLALPGMEEPDGPHVEAQRAAARNSYPSGAFEPPARGSAARRAGEAALSAS